MADSLKHRLLLMQAEFAAEKLCDDLEMGNVIDNAGFAARIRDYIAGHPGAAAKIAKACGVTLQAVYAWKSTGRFHKRHLPKLVAATGKGHMYWLYGESGLADSPTASMERELLDAWRLLTPKQQGEYLAQIKARSIENTEAYEHFAQSQHPNVARTATDVIETAKGRPSMPVSDREVADKMLATALAKKAAKVRNK